MDNKMDFTFFDSSDIHEREAVWQSQRSERVTSKKRLQRIEQLNLFEQLAEYEALEAIKKHLKLA